MKFLYDLAAKLGRQKTKNIAVVDKEGESEAARIDETRAVLNLLGHALYYIDAMQAARLALRLRSLNLCNDPFCGACNPMPHMELVRLPSGSRPMSIGWRASLQHDSSARKKLQRAFTPWWLRRPRWWPLG